ncbi:MAG: tetraacyldisaccharide 4'-kinase, partial [Candidatus Puniceispirillaceae bacterium]
MASTLLRPLGAIYGCATARRVASGRPQAHDIPVICVGNINAGGTGKTPTVIALIQYFQSLGITPHVVSRGYGGSLNTVTQVDPVKHSADQTGDEPLLMAAFAPTWICPNRASGITA